VAMPRIAIYPSEDLVERIDRVKGLASRSAWVLDAIASKLAQDGAPIKPLVERPSAAPEARIAPPLYGPGDRCEECSGLAGSHTLDCSQRPGME
jgi:hypothetical protein